MRSSASYSGFTNIATPRCRHNSRQCSNCSYQVCGRRLAVGLVGRIDAAAVGVGAALVEGDGDVLRAHALDEVPEEACEAEHGVHRIAVPVAHIRQHRVIGAEDVNRGVDEKDQGSDELPLRPAPP